MKLLAIGDPHFTIKNQHDTTALEKGVSQIIDEHTPEIVVVMGDILDQHEKFHVDPFVRSIAFIKTLRMHVNKYGGHLIVLIGNHDRPNNSDFLSGKHPFVGMSDEVDKFTVVDTVKVVARDTVSLVCIPYVPPGKFQDAIDTIEWPEGNVLILAHQEFMGSKMGAIVSMAGDEWSLESPPVISGHIHDHQRLQENILYVGTPYQKTYNESANRTVSLFDLTVHSSPSSTNVLDTEVRLRVPGVVKKHIIRITADMLSEFELPDEDDDYYKIYISGTTQELAAAKKHPRYSELNKMVNIDIKPVATAVTRDVSQEELEFEPVTKTFSQRLNDRVKNSPNLLKIVQELGI